MSTVTAFVAAYAALVASASLLWQIYTWHHRHRSHVQVQVRFAIAVPEVATIEAVSVTATNRSEHAVRISEVGLLLQGTSDERFHQWRQLPGATIPGVIDPHDAGTAFLLHDDVRKTGVDIYEPVTAWVRLSTGEFVKSPPTRLRTRV